MIANLPRVVCSLAVCFGVMFAAPASAEVLVEIVSPVAKTRVVAGSKLMVVVRTSQPVNGVTVMGQGFADIGERAGPGSSFSVPIRVPNTIVGEKSLTAAALFTSGAAYSKEVLVDIVPDSIAGATLSVGGVSHLIFRYVGDEANLPITITTSDGISKLFSSGEGFESFAENDRVARFFGDGSIVATGPGQTNVRFRYLGATTLIRVSVAAQVLRGDFNGDGHVDLADVEHLRFRLGSLSKVSGDARDLNSDGKIDPLDLRILTTLCTRPRCAVQ
jgi:hypothetical protein